MKNRRSPVVRNAPLPRVEVKFPTRLEYTRRNDAFTILIKITGSRRNSRNIPRAPSRANELKPSRKEIASIRLVPTWGFGVRPPPPAAGRSFSTDLTRATRVLCVKRRIVLRFSAAEGGWQIPSRHRCKSHPHTTLSWLLFPPRYSAALRPSPLVLWIVRARGRYVRFGGCCQYPRCDKCSFVCGMAKVSRNETI